LRQLQRKEKGKEEDHVIVGGTSLKRVYLMTGIRKEAGDGWRPLGME